MNWLKEKGAGVLLLAGGIIFLVIGCIRKEFTFFRPVFTVDCRDWQVEGEILEWDYEIRSGSGMLVAEVSKELLNWTDTYAIDVRDPADALHALMVVLAIDAEKCSRN